MSMISEIIDSDNQNRFCSENSESLESLCTSLAALSTAPKGQGMWRDRYTIYPLRYLPFSAKSDEQVFLLYKFCIMTRKTQLLLATINTLIVSVKKGKSHLSFRNNSAVITVCPKRC